MPAHPRAAEARRRARRRRLRRRADGARGAAARDPGRADRGRRAPRAREPARRAVRRRRLPRVPVGRDGEKYARRRPADPARRRSRAPRDEARARARARAGRAGRARLRRLLGRAPPQRPRARRVGRRRARRDPPLRASATTRSCSSRVTRARLHPACRSSTSSAPRTAPPTSSLARAGGSVWELAAAGLPAVLVPSVRDGGAPGEERRATSPTRAARSSCPRRTRGSAVPRVVEELLADPRGSRRWPRRCAPPPSPTQQRRSPMSSSRSQPLAGRRIWIAGIGGAGMSGYALLAHAWGAEVAGWDRVDTPYLAHLDGVSRSRSRPSRRSRPTGWEVLRLDGLRRTGRGPAARGAPRRARLAAARRSSSPARTARRRRAR